MPKAVIPVSMQYDNRLRVSQHQVASGEYSGGYLKKAEFVYYSDSKPKEMDNQVDAVFDRKFEYDFAGRLSRSEFGLYTTQQNTQINPHIRISDLPSALAKRGQRQIALFAGRS
mgnify:CR=1 FL=1